MKIKKNLLPIALMLLPGISVAEITSRAECILTYMPGVMNDTVADLVIDFCRDTYFGSKYSAKPRASGEGGMRDAFDCTLQKAASTTNRDVADAIHKACKELYPESRSSPL